MSPFERLLLRPAKNPELRRGARWLANLAYVYVGTNIDNPVSTDELIETMEQYGVYAETEDPDAFVSAESQLDRALRGVESDNKATAR